MAAVHLDHAALQQTYQLEQYMKCSLIIKFTEFPTPNPVFLQYIEKILIGTEKDTKCF